MCRAIRTLLVSALSVVPLTACGAPEPSGEAFTVTDSAGVSIVESVRPLWQEGEGWTLAPEPEVVIGNTEGDEKYALSEVAGVRRLSDGRIAILDEGSKRVRVYDSAGRHQMDLGGEGDGPSEFRFPQFLGLRSDTLFVYDPAPDRLTWFFPDGEFIRTSAGVRARGRGARGSVTYVIGFLADRFMVGTGMQLPMGRTFVDGLDRDPWSIWRFDVFDSPGDSLLTVPGFEQIIAHNGSGVVHRPHVFGKFTLLAVSKDWIFAAPTDAFSIQVFDGEGTLRRIIRRPWAPQEVGRSDLDAWIEHEIDLRADSPQEEADMRANVGDLSVAETLPAFRWMAVDSEGQLWVEEWKGAGVEQGRFAVFRADGVWLGSVALPDGLVDYRWDPARQRIEIGPDYVLGVWEDELDVEQVRLYRIVKN